MVMGEDASQQPGNFQDVLLHETAVSWIRKRLGEIVPSQAWLETPEAFGTRLKRSCEEVNRDLDVEGLCRGFPKRLRKLKDCEGGRLKH